MENTKYEFTGETKTFCGTTLRRIRALVTIIGVVNSGGCGGWIESENNLQVSGDAWVSGDAQVSGNALVSGNAQVSGNALVSGNAKVSGNALVESKESICLFSGFGSEYRTTTAFFDEKINIRIICGCFTGSLTEFREQVKQTHGDSKNGKLYMQMANMIEYRLSTEE